MSVTLKLGRSWDRLVQSSDQTNWADLMETTLSNEQQLVIRSIDDTNEQKLSVLNIVRAGDSTKPFPVIIGAYATNGIETAKRLVQGLIVQKRWNTCKSTDDLQAIYALLKENPLDPSKLNTVFSDKFVHSVAARILTTKWHGSKINLKTVSQDELKEIMGDMMLIEDLTGDANMTRQALHAAYLIRFDSNYYYPHCDKYLTNSLTMALATCCMDRVTRRSAYHAPLEELFNERRRHKGSPSDAHIRGSNDHFLEFSRPPPVAELPRFPL